MSALPPGTVKRSVVHLPFDVSEIGEPIVFQFVPAVEYSA